MKRSNMIRFRAPGYAAVLLVLVFTAVDFFVAVTPIEIGTAQWRVQAIGFLSGSLVTLLLAGLIALAIALHFEQHRVRKALGSLAIAAGVVLLAAAAVLALDAIELRAQFQPSAANNFEVAMGRALLKLGLGAIVSLVYGWTALRPRSDDASGSAGRGSGAQRSDRPEPMLVSAASEGTTSRD